MDRIIQERVSVKTSFFEQEAALESEEYAGNRD